MYTAPKSVKVDDDIRNAKPEITSSKYFAADLEML